MNLDKTESNKGVSKNNLDDEEEWDEDSAMGPKPVFMKPLWLIEEFKDLESVEEERDEKSTKSEIATTTRPYAQRGGGWD
jgi:hypothetical protein